MKKTKYPGVSRLPDGRFHIRVTGRCPKTGKPKNLKRTIKVSSAAEASSEREALLAMLHRGEVGQACVRPRVEDAAISWLRMKLPTIKRSSRNRYSVALDHVLASLGDVYLDRLTGADIVRWRDNQQGAPATVNGRLRVFKTMLADMTDEYGLRNPSTRVSAIRGSKSRAEDMVLTLDELDRVLASISSEVPKYEAMFRTFALTGMRAGEICALRWANVDFERRVIRVAEARYKQTLDTTKTDEVRTVPMVDTLRVVLLQHRKSLIARQAQGIELCFPSTVGKFIWNSTISVKLRKAVKAAEIDKPFSSHGFRYTLNSLMRRDSADHVIRAITGHSTERMTEHYSSVADDEKRAAVDGVAKLIQLRSRSKLSSEVSSPSDGTKTAGEPLSSTGRNL